MTISATALPPPVPTHYSPPNISIIQPQLNFDSNSKNATIAIVPPSIEHPPYLGKQQQSKKKRNVQANEILEYDSPTSSSDESEGGYSNRFSSQSLNSNPSEEHKFWQVHSSTTIIAPPMTEADFSAINMNYVNTKTLKKRATVAARIPLAVQVRNILSSTFDDVDEEIEREWESSRKMLKKSLIVLPTQSLSSPSY